MSNFVKFRPKKHMECFRCQNKEYSLSLACAFFFRSGKNLQEPNRQHLTLSEPGGTAHISPPCDDHLLYSEGCRYELQTSWQFQAGSHWSPSNFFLEFLPTIFRKLTSNDINPRIFSIEKTKKWFFHFFLVKTPQILFQNWMTIFLRIFLRYYTFF